jgi:hypothetical protein
MTQETKTAGALERLEACEAALTSLKQIAQRDSTAFQYITQKLVLIEQSLAGVAKTLAAVTEELMEKGLVNNDAIMSRIRKIDDHQEQHRIESLKQGGVVVPGASVQPSSLVVLTQKLLAADGKVEVYSEYRTLEMPSVNPQESVYLNALGKKVGDQFTLEGQNSGDNMIFTIKEIYELAPQGGSQATRRPRLTNTRGLHGQTQGEV